MSYVNIMCLLSGVGLPPKYISINRFITIPTWIVDDRTSPYMYYQLLGWSVGNDIDYQQDVFPGGSAVAESLGALLIASANSAAVYHTSVAGSGILNPTPAATPPPSPPSFGSILSNIPFSSVYPTGQLTPPPSYKKVRFSIHDDGTAPDPGLLDLRAEPACHCDIRQLMSQSHPPGCPWMVWRTNRKRLESEEHLK